MLGSVYIYVDKFLVFVHRKDIMPLYKFTIPESAQTLRYNGATTAFVQADTEAAALVLLKAAETYDNNVVWDHADATIVSAEIEGATFSIEVDAPEVDVSYTAVEGDTFATVGAALAALLVADGRIATWTANATHSTLYGTLVIATGSAHAEAQTVELVAGGTGYAAEDTLTVVGGTSSTAVTLTVDAVSTGVITEVSIAGGGDYSVLPDNPVAVTGGNGNDDATFNLTWDAEQPGAGVVTVSVTDAAGNDITAAATGNVVDDGAATASLSVDIKATALESKSAGVIGMYS